MAGSTSKVLAKGPTENPHARCPGIVRAGARMGRLGARVACLALVGLACGGCFQRDAHFTPWDKHGRTYYIDGAGNWGYGLSDIERGLRLAGYRGNIADVKWTISFNPAVDQTAGRIRARLRARTLGQEIIEYKRRYPDQDVNIISLSAGTGVAVWACEATRPPGSVANVVMLGSSLSSNYDMSDALENITGGVWVFHSPRDLILRGPVRVLGTIDGRIGVDAAGLVGLMPSGSPNPRIHNVPWVPRFERYGWTGAHTDATSAPFVQHVLAPVLAGRPTADVLEVEHNTLATAE